MYRWNEQLEKVSTVTQEDVNGFLRLVGERDNAWENWELGLFVSLVLEECYKGRVIELDVGAVEGKIDVGRELNWDGVVYVNGDVDGDIGYEMEKGTIVVEGDVDGGVGSHMKKGVIVVERNAYWSVGFGMKEGIIIVNGEIKHNKWLEELGKGFVVYKGFVYTGRWSE